MYVIVSSLHLVVISQTTVLELNFFTHFGGNWFYFHEVVTFSVESLKALSLNLHFICLCLTLNAQKTKCQEFSLKYINVLLTYSMEQSPS
jgi:hypothetical protein